MIELKGVSFGYDERLLFEGVGLTIRPGEIVQVRGRSGCGKTSFLYLLNRFRRPLNGELFLEGRPYEEYGYPELRAKVIYLHQAPVMLSERSVRENLLLPFSLQKNKHGRVPGDEELVGLLADLHLPAQTLGRQAESLSQGEQQRVAIVRAALLRPDFLLMDEPLANLDPESVQAIQHWILMRCQENTGLVVVSHQPLEELPAGSARVLECSGGGIRERSC